MKYNNAKGEKFAIRVSVKVKSCNYFVSIFKIDLEEDLIFKNVDGLNSDYIKLFLLMYADGIVLFCVTANGLLNGLNCLFDHNQKWKSTVNTRKTK